MQKKQKIFFYTTFGCHLCEQVEAMILSLNNEKKISDHYDIVAVDIIDDEKKLQEYRTTIPVLENEFTGKKLFWPFDYDDLNVWLDSDHSY